MSAAGDPPEIVIRPARPSDREAVVDLHLAVHTELYAPPSLDAAIYIADMRPRALQGRWRSRGIHVAEAGGRIVGYVHVFYDLVNALYVGREVRGRGVGGALLAVAEQQLRRKGVAQARLRVARDREEIVRFYSKHGWRAGKDLGTEKEWDIKLQEMKKQLCEQNRLVLTVQWLGFKLALTAAAFMILLLFGVGLHYGAQLPGGMIAMALLLSALVIGIIILRLRRLNLGIYRSCLVGLTVVGSYLLTFMVGAGLGGLALNLVGIEDLARGNAGYVGPIALFLMSCLTGSYADRLAMPLYLRLL